MAIGSFLPWARAGFISLAGTDGDGILTLFAGVIIVLLAVVGREKPSMVIRLGTVGLFAVSGFVAFNVFANLADELGSSDLFTPSVGGGLILTLLAAGLGFVFSLVWLGRRTTETPVPAGFPTKRCPFCSEEVLVTALVCKHCGRNLVPNPKNPSRP